METAERVTPADLRETDIFTGLSDENLEEIAQYCTQRTYMAGDYCNVQGKTADQLLIVNGGNVVVEMRVEVPRHSLTVTIATLTKGCVTAWSTLVPPHTLTASVRCVENALMIVINGSDLQRVFNANRAIEATVMRNLAGIISSRYRDSITQISCLCSEVFKEGLKYKEP